MSVNFDLFGISSVIPAETNICYVAPNHGNGIFAANLDTWNIRRICEIPWKYPFFAVDMIEKSHVIWCVARKGLQIACYDLRSGKISMYIEDNANRDNLTAALQGNDIYIFPKDLPGEVVRFSIMDKAFYDLKTWNKDIKNKNIEDHLRTYTIADGKIAATLKTSSQIIIFDMKNQSFYVKPTGITDTLFGITAMESGYYLTSFHSKTIYHFNTITNKILSFENLKENGFYHQILKTGDCHLLSGATGLDVFRDGTFRSVIKRPKRTYGNIGSAYIFSQVMNSKLLLWPWNANKLLEIDKDTFQYKERTFQMHFHDYIRLFPILIEGDMTLADYTTAQYKTNKKYHKNKETIGEKIFTYIQGIQL